jgi:hypothetical protein
VSRRNKRNRWAACRIKKVHHDFWTALQHCVSLQKAEPFASIYIYKCDFCSGMHVTRGHAWKNTKKISKALKKNLAVMGNLSWWYKAPPAVINHRITLEIYLLKKAYAESIYYGVLLNETTIP